MASDLDQLIEMGFDKERAELAVKKTGGRKLSHPMTYACIIPSNTVDSARGARVAGGEPGQVS